MLPTMTSRQRTAIHVALVAALVLLTTSFAPREAEADPLLDVGKGDVSVQADKLEVDVATGSAVLTGQVVLSKGDMNVRCPRVELKFDTSPHLNWAKGSGGVVADVRGVHGEAPGGRARPEEAGARASRRREAVSRPGLDPGGQGDHRARERQGDRHAGEGLDPRPEAVSDEPSLARVAAIESRAIRVARGDKMILRGVSIRGDAGEVVGVLGPSGAGQIDALSRARR